MRRIILAFLAALLLLPGVVTASASGGDVLSAQSEALELDGLEDAAGDWLPGVELEAGLSLDEGLQSIVDTGSGELFGVVRKAVRSGVLLLAVVLLCGLAEGLYAGTGAGRAVDVVSIVGALAVAAVAAADANTLIGLGREALDNMSTFSKLLLPTVTAAAGAARSPPAGGALLRPRQGHARRADLASINFGLAEAQPSTERRLKRLPARLPRPRSRPRPDPSASRTRRWTPTHPTRRSPRPRSNAPGGWARRQRSADAPPRRLPRRRANGSAPAAA